VHQILKLPAVWLVLSMGVVCGLGLIVLSFWTAPYTDGQQALKQEMYKESLDYFEKAEGRFESLSLAKYFLPDTYHATLANQFYILYQLGDYDTLLEKAASSPLLAPIHYWTGCTLFRRAGQLSEPQEQIAWLEKASSEFLNVLKFEPENWDAKYNYELTNRLIDDLKDEKETPPQMLEILRPRPRQGEQPLRQTG
jgi:tetratricopeptide (TPR) repeat protein